MSQKFNEHKFLSYLVAYKERLLVVRPYLEMLPKRGHNRANLLKKNKRKLQLVNELTLLLILKTA